MSTLKKAAPEARKASLMTVHTASKLLSSIATAIPGIWKTIDEVRAQARAWDDRVCIPRSVLGEVLSLRGAPQDTDVNAICALAGWRPGLDVYTIEPEILNALISTPVWKIPAGILTRIPAWTVYLDVQNSWMGDSLDGFFCFFNAGEDKSLSLVIMGHCGGRLFSLFELPLSGDGDIDAALKKGLQSWTKAKILWDQIDPGHWAQYREAAGKVLSILLYLCSTEPDVRDTAGDRSPKTKKDKGRMAAFSG